MKIVISHISAVRFWVGESAASIPARAVDGPAFASEPFATRMAQIRQLASSAGFGDEKPLHLLTSESGARTTGSITYHRHMGPLPKESLLSLAKGVYIVSPELAFAQAGTFMAFAEQVRLGMRLCASYRLSEGEIISCQPITSRVRLSRLLEQLKGRQGIKASRRAAAYVADGSGSPMESCSFMLACLPRANGGYRRPAPVLNHVIELDDATALMVPQSYFKCDLYWPAQKVAIEYDSDLFHTGSDRIMQDNMRRNALKHMGIKVTTIGRQQLLSPRLFDIAMRQITKDLGMRINEPFAPDEDAVRRLRGLLFSNPEFPSLH